MGETDCGTQEVLPRSCKNCGNTFKGKFCNVCGQKVIKQRFTIKNLFSEGVNIVLNYDRGFLYTLKMLFINPGKVIREYTSGSTIKYYNPLRYAFILAGLSALIVVSSGMYDVQQESFQNLLGNDGSPKKESYQELQNKLKEYFSFILLLTIPVMAFSSKLFFKKQGYNYAEHLILHCFIVGQTMIIGLLLLLPYIIFGYHPLEDVVSYLFTIAYYIWVVRSLFGLGWLNSILRTVGFYLLGFMITLAMGGIIGAIFIITYIFTQKIL